MQNQKNRLSNWIPILIALAFMILMIWQKPFGSGKTELKYSEFHQVLKAGAIQKATISINHNTISVSGTFKDAEGVHEFTTLLPHSETETNTILDQLRNTPGIEIADANSSNIFLQILGSALPLVGTVIFGIYIMRAMSNAGGGQRAFDFSRSKARVETDIRTRFSDVAGSDEEKEEMAELIEYLKMPRKFAKMGARIPKGIILVGPPGTGKTLLAKAVAGEANVPFYSISGSDFVEMFVGVGASRVRDMFKQAKLTAPCMIFIDEIDAVGRQRGAGMGGGNDEREQTLNQLLVEMDGMNDNSGIIIIAATNRPDVLDPALLRPGRFDRQITVSLPDVKAREAILAVHTRNKKIDEDVDLSALARRTPGFSGADLENVLNEAAILSVRQNKESIGIMEVDEAIDRVMMGPAKKSRTYDDATKKLVAYHEAGHAIVGLNQEGGNVVQKVTIIPRGQAGGYNLMTPKKDSTLHTKGELLQIITSYMGGRCAEEIFFGDISTGASDDIKQATHIARDMVTVYGMSELGPIQYNQGNRSVFLGRDYNSPLNVSSQIAYDIDVEVRKIVESGHEKALEIINAHKDDLIKIAEALMVNETLTAEEIDLLLKGDLAVIDKRLVSTITKEDILAENCHDTVANEVSEENTEEE